MSERLSKFSSVVEDEQEFVAIELCMKKGNELLITIRQLLGEMGEKRSERRSASRSASRKREQSVYGVETVMSHEKVSVSRTEQNLKQQQQQQQNQGSLLRSTTKSPTNN